MKETMFKFRLAALAITLSMVNGAAPASAAVGGLVGPNELIDTFETNCSRTGPVFSNTLPARARQQRWDELQGATAARRGWMIAVGGSPVVLDITTVNPRTQTCSVSAVTIPQAVVAMLENRLKLRAKKENKGGMLVSTLIRTVNGRRQAITIATPNGKSMARITLQYI